MRQDILTLSRVIRLLIKHDIMEPTQSIDSPETAAHLCVKLHENAIQADLLEIIYTCLPATESAQELILGYLAFVIDELQDFASEIERRRAHAIGLGIYEDDTPEQVLAKLEESKKLYPAEQYFACWTFLAKAGIDATQLTVSESLLAMEELLCEKTNEATAQILSLMEDDNKSFAKDTRDILRHANFYSFALDIFNMVDEMYRKLEGKRDRK